MSRMLYPQERHQNKQNPREITPDEATHSKIKNPS